MGVINFKLLIEYDGTAFHGWQAQRNGRTVQVDLQKAIEQVTQIQGVSVVGAGRTDAGVHARGQVAHVKLATNLPPERFRQAVNSNLSEDVRLRQVEVVSLAFHARRNAVERRYNYAITTTESVLGRHYEWYLKGGLDRDLLWACAKHIEGRHDFGGFSKRGQGEDNTECHVSTSRWAVDGPRLEYQVAADRFLHHMIRYLVGTMVEVARGRYSVDQFRARLDGDGGSLVIRRAPAQGLVMEGVGYEDSGGA